MMKMCDLILRNILVPIIWIVYFVILTSLIICNITFTFVWNIKKIINLSRFSLSVWCAWLAIVWEAWKISRGRPRKNQGKFQAVEKHIIESIRRSGGANEDIS